MTKKYYLLVTINYSDGTADKVNVYTYATRDEAVAHFHQYMGNYMLSSNVSHAMATVIDSDAITYQQMAWSPAETEDEAETE